MEDSLSQINNALTIVNQLIPLVDQAENKFKSARNWGIVDLFGGGLLTDIIKHSQLGAASNIMNQISILLNDLRRVLGNIQIPVDYNMQLGGFSTFADFVFDGVLADAWMQSKIISSLDQVRQLKQRLTVLQERLNTMAQNTGR